MGRLARTSLRLVVAAVLALAAWAGFSFTASTMAEMKVKEFFAGMQDVVRADYAGVDVNPLTMTATIRDLRLEIMGGMNVTMDEFVLERYEEHEGLPVSVEVACRGVSVPVVPGRLGGLAPRLLELGYEVLHLDYELDMDYDLGSRRFSLSRMHLAVRDAAELGMRLELHNVNLEALAAGGPALMFLAVERGELVYRDRSLFSRVLGSIAAEQGVSPQEVAGTLAGGLAARREQALAAGDKTTAEALAALARFVADPGSMTVRVAPQEPVALMQLAGVSDPAEGLRRLRLTIENE